MSNTKNDENESHMLLDFSACVYNNEAKQGFEEAFDIMSNKVDKDRSSWLDSIYKFKQKWDWMLYEGYFQTGNEKHTYKWEF